MNKIFSNDKALIVVAFLLALVVWLAISINGAPEIEVDIENVKVTIDDSVPSQLGYDAFGVDNVYVDITVKGQRYQVGNLTADDFEVVAVTSHVDSPGTYSLQLKATAKDADANYEITSKSMDNIEVYFDVSKTQEFLIQKDVICESDNLLYSDEYTTADPIISSEKIKITGPATEVAKIKNVVATATTTGELKATETLDTTVTIADAYGAEIKFLSYDIDITSVTITIPVYVTVELPLTVDFENLPTKYLDPDNALIASIYPSTIDIAVDVKKAKSLESISLGTIDFNTLTVGTNTIELDTSNITDGIPIKENQTFKVVVTVEE